MIAVHDITVRAASTTILSSVSLELRSEITALVGPSGAGKSTLLRVIVGLERPSEGRVRLGERLATIDSEILIAPEARHIGMVFQDLALWPHFSVHENLAFGLAARGVPRSERERRIGETLEWVSLGAKAKRFPAQLSGGERQRVAIARALVLEPVALLLDEPLGSLDVVLKRELLDLLARLVRQRALPTLYVTHDPFEAATLADRIVVLENGSIVQSGTAEELAREPKTPFVSAFVKAMKRDSSRREEGT
jgi:ABC-type sulfate/molybdate transport systems ATPase subunit